LTALTVNVHGLSLLPLLLPKVIIGDWIILTGICMLKMIPKVSSMVVVVVVVVVEEEEWWL